MTTVIHKPRHDPGGDIGKSVGTGLGEGLKAYVGEGLRAKKSAEQQQFMVEMLGKKQVHSEKMKNLEQKGREELQEEMFQFQTEQAKKDREAKQEAARTRQVFETEQARRDRAQTDRLSALEFEDRDRGRVSKHVMAQGEQGAQLYRLQLKLDAERDLFNLEASIKTSRSVSEKKLKVVEAIIDNVGGMYEFDDAEENIASFMERIRSVAAQAGINTAELQGMIEKKSPGLWEKIKAHMVGAAPAGVELREKLRGQQVGKAGTGDTGQYDANNIKWFE
jgi:hypothetical protein